MKPKAKPRGRPWRKGEAPKGGRPKGVPNKVTREIRELAQAIFTPQVWAKLREQAEEGKLPPAILNELLHYGWGKPKERVEAIIATPVHAEWLADESLRETAQEALERILAAEGDGS